MNRGILLCRASLCMLALLCAGSVWGQKPVVPSRIVDAVEDTRIVRLQGNVHPMARAASDQGALADSQPMTHMLLLLQRSAEQELALRQVLDAQQTKGSGNYHGWLTPAQFGTQYGPSDTDIQTVTDWLTRQGFQVGKVSAGRLVIEFSGNVAQVKSAFHTEIHRFTVNGETHFANLGDPAIPQALSPVVAGVVALHNFRKEANLKNKGVYRRDKATGQLSPLFTYGSPLNFALGPGDFKTIYSVPATPDGTGQSIAIVGQSNIAIADVHNFRSLFGLPANDPQIILNGPDPGLVLGDEGESDLDVEWAGAIAPAAHIIFVATQSSFTDPTQVIGGVDSSALYIVDNNLAPVLSESYGACEAALGTTFNAFYNAMWQQAAAEGISVFVASGDNGSAACDPTSAAPDAAANGVAVSGIASTPYNVAVGGTDFDPSTTTQTNTYWTLTGGTLNSALKYMPETPWDDSECAFNYPAVCSSVDTSQFITDIVAGGGGPSNCEVSGSSSCTNGYAKPAFQTGSITPADGVRDLPDVSLFASNGGRINGGAGVAIVVCQADVNPNNVACDLNTPYADFALVGGTSASTPAFAGIMALVNQQTGERQGNANYVLYALAANDTNYTTGKCNASLGHTPASTCVFNDVTAGNNAVACVGGTTNCNASSGFGVLTFTATDFGTPAFQAVAGYDLATGLGSVNVTNLLAKWTSAARAATTTALGSPSSTTPTSGQAFTVQITVTPSSATGNVSLTALASDKTTILGSVGPFTLSAGSVSASSNLLPPGTANIEGYYGGDVTHGSSTSTPLAVAVSGANQVSQTILSFVTFDANNNPVLSTGAQSLAYGSPYILQIAIVPKATGKLCTNGGTSTTPAVPCPTGTVALTDSGSPLNDWPIAGTLNATNQANVANRAISEDQPIQLPAGSHSLSVAFTPGDTNFQASTSNTLSVTITKAATTVGLLSSLSSITPGTSVTLTAYVATNSGGNGPTGTMSFTNGSTSIGTANCVPTSGAANINPPVTGISAGTGYCTATLPNVAISSLHPLPGDEPRGPGLPVIPAVMALLSALLFALGWKWMPEPRRRAYAYAGLLAFALLAAGIAGCGGGGGGTGGGGTRTITAAYPGDTNYTSSSGSVPITIQ